MPSRVGRIAIKIFLTLAHTAVLHRFRWPEPIREFDRVFDLTDAVSVYREPM
jgi:hypothetical protein